LTSASPLGYLGNTAITFIAYAPPGAGDAEVKATENTAASVTGGLNVTQALIYGRMRLSNQFALLGTVKQADLAMQLITAPWAINAWDIGTLKYRPTGQERLSTQIICTAGQGISATKPTTLVTVRDGAGNLEVYPTDAVNYYLYGAIMKMVWLHQPGILAAVQSDPDVAAALAKIWPQWLLSGPLDRTYWGWTAAKNAVVAWRGLVTSREDGAGVSAPVAFAQAGWYNDWNYINGLGIKDAKPSATVYTGMLEWTLGDGTRGANTMIDFLQSGSDLGTWKNLK